GPAAWLGSATTPSSRKGTSDNRANMPILSKGPRSGVEKRGENQRGPAPAWKSGEKIKGAPLRRGKAGRKSKGPRSGVKKRRESGGWLDGGARAGEQPVVGVFQLRVAQEDQVGELLGERTWRPDEAHARLAQQPV